MTWNFKNQSDPLKTGGKHKIPALEPFSSCKRAFKLEIINVTADDEESTAVTKHAKIVVEMFAKVQKILN